MSIPDLPPPNKRLGQNFLIDPNIVRKIVALAELGPSDHVLEIGPGRGILTEALCHAAGRVTAVEVDPRLHAYLKTRQAELPNADLVCADALAYSVESLPMSTVVVANLPYYISTPLLFRLLDQRGRFPRMVLMLQAEVADRLVAKPGGSDYGCSQSWRSTQPRLPNRFVSQPSVSAPDRRSPQQCCCCARKSVRGLAGRKKSHFARS